MREGESDVGREERNRGIDDESKAGKGESCQGGRKSGVTAGIHSSLRVHVHACMY